MIPFLFTLGFVVAINIFFYYTVYLAGEQDEK